MNTILDMLNDAFKADPGAIHTLLINRVPCNEKLADDPHFFAVKLNVADQSVYFTNGLELINTIMNLLGYPLIDVEFSEDLDSFGRKIILGLKERKIT